MPHRAVLPAVLRLFHVDHAAIEVRFVEIQRLPHGTVGNVDERHAAELVRLLLSHHAHLAHFCSSPSPPAFTNVVLRKQLSDLIFGCVVGKLAKKHRLRVNPARYSQQPIW